MYDMFYNVGDSHTWTSDLVPLEQQYWYKIYQNLIPARDFYNFSQCGRSNDRNINQVYYHILSNPGLDTFYCINLTFYNRIDVNSAKSLALHDVLSKQAIADYDWEFMENSMHIKLCMLIDILHYHNKKFIVINNTKNYWREGIDEQLVQKIQSENRVLNWFENGRISFHQTTSKIKPHDFDQFDWQGHDGPNGHAAYYQLLERIIKKRQLDT